MICYGNMLCETLSAICAPHNCSFSINSLDPTVFGYRYRFMRRIHSAFRGMGPKCNENCNKLHKSVFFVLHSELICMHSIYSALTWMGQ